MSEETISPFGGDNLPLRELKKQAKVKEALVKKNSSKFLLVVLMVAVFLLMLIILLLLFKLTQKTPVTPSPSPVVLLSPSPQATGSGMPKSLPERLKNLEKNLQEVDLHQTQFSFPILDFKIDLKSKK